jgi:GNAT superfamily N-acetyltransferase
MSRLDHDLQAYLRQSVLTREIERVGPFLSSFSRHSENPFLNYAIPDDGAEPSPDDMQALIAAYEARGRIPRLEYFPSVAPAVEAALLAAGFAAEDRLPVMTCTRDDLRESPPPDGIELVLAVTENDLFIAMSAANEAYGEARPPDHDDVIRQLEAVASGLGYALARDVFTGEPAGSGVFTVPHDGVTEVAGIGVRSAHRNRGIARALCAFLTRTAFDAGVTLPFLMCEQENEERVYGRVGYATTSTILHISRAGL